MLRQNAFAPVRFIEMLRAAHDGQLVLFAGDDASRLAVRCSSSAQRSARARPSASKPRAS